MTVIALIVFGVVATPAARGGEWVQVSCENPNGTAATSQGWSASAAGSPPPGSTVNTNCGPGAPLSAGLLSAFGGAPGGSAEILQYTPPAGSTLTGGVLQISLSSTSGGPNLDAVSETSVFSPADTLSERLIDCTPYISYCPNGTTSSTTAYAGPLDLPAGRGGGVTVVAQCDGASGTSCDQGGSGGYWALAEVQSAQLLLSSDVSPEGTGFSGSAVQRAARGTAHLVFLASDPGGPGVYSVAATVGGRTVWSGQPNDNGGACVAAGSDGGALMFDSAQPCLATETVDVPVATRQLSNGRHELAVTVTDAAGNTSPVFDREITVANPTPVSPTVRPGEVHARLQLAWDFRHHRTRLLRAFHVHLPARGRVTLTCLGRRCPRLRVRRERAARAARIWRELEHARFRPRQRLVITFSAPRRRSEPIELIFRDGRTPRVRLLARPPRKR